MGDKTSRKMSRLTLLAAFLLAWLAFVALSYANPIDDLFELEEEEDYPDYDQSIGEHRGAEDHCIGRIQLLTPSGASKSTTKSFKIRANERRYRVAIEDIKVTGNCCWLLTETNYRWEQDFTGGAESTINKYIYNGMKLEC